MILIKEVKDKHDLKTFIRFPWELYKDNPYFVPSLESEDYKTLTSHPAKEFCSLRMWIAYKDGKPAGRIAGIINHRYNKIKDQKRVRFGWFDVIDDFDVAKALFITVARWGKEMNMFQLSGPSRFSNMEKQGLLVWGYNNDVQPVFTEYNAPYYADFIERLSFVKEVDYVQYKIKVNNVPERIEKLSNEIMARNEVRIKEFTNKKDLFNSFQQFFETLNQSYANIYNFIPLTDKEIAYLIKNNLRFIRKEFVGVIVDKEDNIVGFSLSMPSLSRTFQKLKGKLFPLGWWRLLRACKHPQKEIVNLVLTGVLPQWQSKGIHVLYHSYLNQVYFDNGFQYAISNPQLEDNVAARIWQKYDAELLFRRRCYIRNL